MKKMLIFIKINEKLMKFNDKVRFKQRGLQIAADLRSSGASEIL